MERLLEELLINKAKENRCEVTRMFAGVGNGHFGGSFSCTEIVTALYYHVLNIRPETPEWPGRDRFIISKGHGAPTVYAALADKGFFPREWLKSFDKYEGPLNTHPNRTKVPGIEVSTGSLGHGLSIGAGMALASRHLPEKYRVYVLLGDGESHEGSVWEAAMFASHNKLENLFAVVDHNKLCVDGPVEEVVSLSPLDQKWSSFGWEVVEIDGHNYNEIISALETPTRGIPRVIIAHTIKGKGVSFMENKQEWHGAHVDEEIVRKVLVELS